MQDVSGLMEDPRKKKLTISTPRGEFENVHDTEA